MKIFDYASNQCWFVWIVNTKIVMIIADNFPLIHYHPFSHLCCTIIVVFVCFLKKGFIIDWEILCSGYEERFQIHFLFFFTINYYLMHEFKRYLIVFNFACNIYKCMINICFYLFYQLSSLAVYLKIQIVSPLKLNFKVLNIKITGTLKICCICMN